MNADHDGPGPEMARRRLRSELRKLREAAGRTQREVAEAMEWSRSKVIRIETGAFNVSTNDLRALLELYRVGPDRGTALVELARTAREVPRWNIYRDVASPEFLAFLECESSASIIRNFEPLLIPGLLQTEEYAREVLTAFEGEDDERVEALVDLRMERQEVLYRRPLTELHFILDEAALSRTVGPPDTVRAQQLRLSEVARLPNVTIRVVPFTAGMYTQLRVPYVLFEFPDPEDETVLYLEHPFGEEIIRESAPERRGRATPSTYLGHFWQLEQLAGRTEFRGGAG